MIIIMMINNILLSRSKVLSQLVMGFCSEAPVPEKKSGKSYYMPQKPKNTQIYKPTKVLKFRDGRCLVYLNKQNLLTPFVLGLHYTIPLTYMGYLIATNPFYLTFPAALPLLCMLEGFVLLRWIAHKAHMKRQIERVYLLFTGEQIEIHYSNKIRRYVKDNDMMNIIINREFEPRYKGDERVMPARGTPFPDDPDTKYEDAKTPLLLQYGWTLRTYDFESFVLPSNCDYMDWQLLIKIFTGNSIKLDETNSVMEGNPYDADHPPTVEEQYEYVMKQLKKGQKKQQKKDGSS